LVAELEVAGIALSTGDGPATGGRRGALVDLIASARVVLTVDISTTPAQHAFTDLRGMIVPRSVGDVPALAMRSPRHLTAWIARRARTRANVIGVGVAVPGVTDPTTGQVEWAPSLKWRSVDLGATLSAAIDVPVVVDNDLNLASLGEYAFANRDLGDLVMLGVRGGLGAGVIIGGALHRGVHYSAGEVGYLPYPGQPTARDFGPLEGALFARTGRSEEDNARVVELITYACISLSAILDINTIILGDDITSLTSQLAGLVSDHLDQALPHPPQVIASVLGQQASLRGAGFAVLHAASLDIRRVIA
jgi:hypothetical protein